MATASPITATTGIVSISILINGKAINDTYQVRSVIVSNKVNEIPFAQLLISDGDPSEGIFPISSSPDLVPGNAIVISAGYQGNNSVLFSGIVTKQSIRAAKNEPPALFIECMDNAVKMTIGKKSAYFKAMKDSDAIVSVINSYDLKNDVSPTSGVMNEIVQYQVTDWDFILSRADVNGMVILVNEGKVAVKNIDTSLAPLLQVTYGESLLNFDLEMDARTQVSKIQVRSWDMATQMLIEARSGKPEQTTPGNISSATLAAVAGPSEYKLPVAGLAEQQQLQTMADAAATRSAMAKIRGSVSFQGSAFARPGTMMTLSGLGDRFNGNAFISGVTHTIANGNWTTDAYVGLPVSLVTANSGGIRRPSSSHIHGVQGLQTGIVTKTDQDPDGQFRIQVKMPAINEDESVVWARMVGFYATSGAGAFFYPEIGDEVILGFMNDDPGHAVILGSLYSSQKSPAYGPDAKNTYKGIVTSGQLKIEFNDDKKIINIITPNNNIITLSDTDKSITIADQNINKVTLSSSGISMSSVADINITANGNITMSAYGDIALNATQNTDIDGTNVKITAAMQATVDGTIAQLTGSGEVMIKGGMVMIN